MEPPSMPPISEERKKQIQQQLMLLLHAYKCIKKENLNPNPEVCHVNYCHQMREVMKHMSTCRQFKDCTTQHCVSSRQILLHYKICKQYDCRICFPFRGATITLKRDNYEEEPDR